MSLLALGFAAGCASQSAPAGRAVAHADLRREPADRRASTEPDAPRRLALVVEVVRFEPGALIACGRRGGHVFDATVVRVVSPGAHAGRELALYRERARPHDRSLTRRAAGLRFTLTIDPERLDDGRWLMADTVSLTLLGEGSGAKAAPSPF